MSIETLSKFLGLPELKITDAVNIDNKGVRIYACKTSKVEVCPKCATKTRTTYHRRTVTIEDQPIGTP